MSQFDLRFSPSAEQDTGTFRLLELPPELCQLFESGTGSSAKETCMPILSVKGLPTEDAVVCTTDKTYTPRSVVLSNTVLVVTPSRTDPNGTVHVRDQLHEVLELVPSVPKLHKLSALLRGMEYDEGDEDRRVTLPKYSYEQAQGEIQASDAELSIGLRERRILVLDGYLRPIAPAHLNTILELLLSYLTSLGLSHDAAPVEDLIGSLADEHEVPRQVSNQVMSWFGQVDEGTWRMDVDAVVAEIGLGIIRHYKASHHESLPEADLMTKWKNAVGDAFESAVSLKLLSGNYLRNPSDVSGATLNYLPASALPSDPAARFAELFLTRPRWRSDEIEPFLSDIAVNVKERDKLLLKYARAITTPQGIWYTARVGYSG